MSKELMTTGQTTEVATVEDHVEKFRAVNKAYDTEDRVAVLVSGGFGAGWSTWADDEYKEFFVFDSGLVDLASKEATEDEVQEYLNICGIDKEYLGGWSDVRVEWVPRGVQFKIDEYDGSESLCIVGEIEFMVA